MLNEMCFGLRWDLVKWILTLTKLINYIYIINQTLGHDLTEGVRTSKKFPIIIFRLTIPKLRWDPR